MNQSKKHTATPWEVIDVVLVAYTTTREEREANRKLAEVAVNSHAALVEALKDVKDILLNQRLPIKPLSVTRKNALETIESALKLAGE